MAEEGVLSDWGLLAAHRNSLTYMTLVGNLTLNPQPFPSPFTERGQGEVPHADDIRSTGRRTTLPVFFCLQLVLDIRPSVQLPRESIHSYSKP